MSLFTELKRRNVIRVAIAYLAVSWFIIQVVETLFPVFGLADSAIRKVVLLLTIGLPIFLVFSWLYELTPEGIKKESDVDRSRPDFQRGGKRLDRVIIVVLVLSLGYFAVDKFVLEPARDQVREQKIAEQARSEALIDSYGEYSIAVLPFVNRSDDAGNEYFSDGISEELLNLLATVPDLRVISRSSSFSFKGQEIDMPTLAERLGVSYIVEGSVRKAGNRVRISAQLVDARSDTHLWSETYDRELVDVFAIQDEISAAMVAELAEKLGLGNQLAQRSSVTDEAEAHEAYLRGRYLVVQRTEKSIRDAISEFKTALKIDPDYALAHAELGLAYIFLGYYSDSATTDETLHLARPAIDQAMALDPLLAQAHAASGLLLHFRRQTPHQAQRHFLRAIEINPNYSDAYLWLGSSYAEDPQPHYKAAFDALEKSVQLNPVSAAALRSYADSLVRRNRLVEADAVLRKLESIDPLMHATVEGFRKGYGGQWAERAIGSLNAMRINPEEKKQWGSYRIEMARMGLEAEAMAAARAAFPKRQTIRAMDTLHILGKNQEALEVAQSNLLQNPESENAKILLSIARTAAGIYTEEDSGALEQAWSSEPMGWKANDLADLVASRRHFDSSADVSDVLAVMKDHAAQLREAGITWSGDADYYDGLARFLEGNEQEGLELIYRSVEQGQFIRLNDGGLKTLRENPGFDRTLELLQARQKEQREDFLNRVCYDSPYQDVWQPQPGTCEAFVEEQSKSPG